MLSFVPSNWPITIIRGGRDAGRIIYAHTTEDPRLMITGRRPSSYFAASEFGSGRAQPNLDDVDSLYRALDGHGSVPHHLAGQFARASAEAEKRAMRQFKLEDPDAKLGVVPQAVPNQREMTLIAGPSGTGKTTWAAQYARMYKAAFPGQKVYVFTSKHELDPAYAGLTEEDLPFDLEGLDQPPFLAPEHLRDSLCIFDDVENVQPKSLRDAVFALKKAISETGRSSNVYLIVISHRPLRGNETKDDLNESDGMIVFPRRGTTYHANRMLQVYGGLNKSQAKRVIEDTENTRWVYCKLKGDIPAYLVSESEIAFL
jgi:energy-coupling factor transporter ATP-binding protein EcfA2